MRRIKEIIVVEGKHDVAFLKTFLDAEFIETNGLGLNDKIRQTIKNFHEQGYEFIILTDPDFPGERIRKEVEGIVPNCKHAFIKKKNAISKNKKKVGVEHTTQEEILNALENCVTYSENLNQFEMKDLIELGLTGQDNSMILRLKIEEEYCLGHGSTKTFLRRLNLVKKNKEEIIEKIKEIKDGTYSNSKKN
jgi:ribonuclease M5